MVLEKYIDFEKILDNVANDGIGGCADDKCFKMKSKKCKYVVDCDISKIKKEKIDEIFEMIKSAEKETYAKYDENIEYENDDVSIEINFTHMSENEKYIVCFFVFEDEDDSNMLGLVNTENDKYVFLGCSGSHPYIGTNDFEFGNSDGSGPDISKHFKRKCDGKTILKYLKKYYREFTNNDHH